MCNTKGIELTDHHVVEAPEENGEVYTIRLCKECHTKHEKYRNYLRDVCHIDIDKRNKK